MKERVRVLGLEQVEPIMIGETGSWSRLLLTGKTVGASKVMLGYSIFKPGTDTPQKIHEEEELAYVLSGRGQITVGDETVAYEAGQALYIPAGVPHGVRVLGDEDVAMVFVFSYPDYPPTTDA